MREIKFRGLSFDKGWIYGNLIKSEQSAWIRESDYYNFKVKYETVGQYTGLHDKNGKEIYEGDILRFSDIDTAVVEWNEKYSYFMVKPIQDYYFDSDVLGEAIEYNKVETIGNIYENSNLLKN